MSSKPSIDPTQPDPVQRLLRHCIQHIADAGDFPTLAASLSARVEDFAAPLLSAHQPYDPDLGRAILLGIARAMWRTTPHPAHRYAPAPLPNAGRNDPCPCGSGRKYKQCCLTGDSAPEPALNPAENMATLIECLPRRRWPELVGSRINGHHLFELAFEWNRQGRCAEVVHLLEPWFADDKRFDERHENLLDALIDAYNGLHQPNKKRALIARAEGAGDRVVRASMLHRRVSIASDAGDFAEAWRLFREAQRLLPDAPSLAHLEVIVLFAERRDDEARERARFWAHRLAARREPALQNLIDLLRGVVERGRLAMHEAMIGMDPTVEGLIERIAALPTPEILYRLEPAGEEAGPLQASERLDEALEAWTDIAPSVGDGALNMGNDEDLLEHLPALLPLLDRMPQLWSSFEVLDYLVRAADSSEQFGIDDLLVRPLLLRAEHLLRDVLARNDCRDLRLSWGFLENRPALRLIGELIRMDLDEQPPGAEHVARLEWLVLRLNPIDNQGLRNHLMRRYLELDRADEAIALSERYPDDVAAMRYNRALALYASGQEGKALIALRDAYEHYPKPLDWLLRDKPRKPMLMEGGMHIGGDDEAWYYRDDMLPTWRALAALDWARQARNAFKRIARSRRS